MKTTLQVRFLTSAYTFFVFCKNPFHACALRWNPAVTSGVYMLTAVWVTLRCIVRVRCVCSSISISMYSLGCHHGGFLYSNSREWVVSVCRYECSWHPPHWLQSFPLTILSQCTSITVSVAVSQCLCCEELADIETHVLVYSLVS